MAKNILPNRCPYCGRELSEDELFEVTRITLDGTIRCMDCLNEELERILKNVETDT